MSIIYRSNQTMTSPPPNAPIAPGRASYRAGFSGGDTPDLVGEQTDSGDGLDVAAWQGTAGILKIESGSVVGIPDSAGFVGVPVLSTQGAHMTWLVRQMPTDGIVYLDLFRPLSGAPLSYRLGLDADFGARLMVRLTSSNIVALTDWIPIASGQTAGIRYLGGTLSMVIDQIPRVHVLDDQVPVGNFAGIATSSTGAGFELDNFQVDVY